MFKILKQNQKHFSMYAVLILIFVVFGFMTNFINFAPRNITNLVIQNSYILILATGMVLVIITGKIDLSVGSAVALTGAIAAWAYNKTDGSMMSAVAIALLAGVVMGAVQGYWVAYLKVPAFIVTLGGMLGWRGLTYIFTDIQPIGLMDDGFKTITTGFVNPVFMDAKNFALLLGIVVVALMVTSDWMRRQKRVKLGFDNLPLTLFALKNLFIAAVVMWVFYKFSMDRGVPIIICLIAVLIVGMTYVMNNTVFGRNIYAIGGNAKAAKLSGIDAERTEFYVFVLMGVLAALAGVVFTAYMNQAQPAAGNMFELDAISAVFIGGASATGGVGTILGSIIGGLVMGVINNGMSLMSLGQEYQLVLKAVVLLVAVWYDLYNNKKSS